MIGRTEVVDRLVSLIGTGTSVVITGEAGVGKSALLRHALDRLPDGYGTFVLSGTPPAREIPFAAVSHLLDGVAAIDQAVLIHQLATRVIDAAPAVVAVDDIDLIDEATRALLDRLARTDEVAVVATLRAKPPGDAPAGGPLVPAWSDVATLLELEPLDEAATEQLGTRLLGGPLTVGLTASLWRKTHGNPLFVSEVLLASKLAGVVRQERDHWVLDGDLEAGARVADLVERRLDGLDAEQRRCLELIAVAEPLPLARLTTVFAPTIFADLERRSLLRADQAGGAAVLRLAHPIVGEVLRDGLGTLGRRAVLTELATCFDPATVEDGESLRLASWLLDLGEPVDPGLLARGAAEALDRFEPELAERLLRAVDHGGEPSILAMLGAARRGQGRVDEATPLLATAFEAATEVADIVRCAGALVDVYLYDLADLAQAQATIDAGLARLEEAGAGHPELVQLQARAFLASGMAGDFDTVLADGDRLLEQPLPPPVEGALLMACTLAQAMTGRLDGVVDRLDRADRLATADGGSNPVLVYQLRLNRPLALHSLARLDASRACGEHLRSESLDPARRGGALFVDSLSLLLAGAVDEVVRHTSEAASLMEQGDPLGMLTLARSCQAYALALSNRTSEAAKVLDQLAGAVHIDEPRMIVWHQQAEAWIEARGGRAEAGAERAVAAGRRAVAGQHHVWGAHALHCAVVLGHPSIALEPLAELVAVGAGPLVELLSRHADAAADADPIGLDKVAADLVAAGALGVAVDAWAAASLAEPDEHAAARLALLAHEAAARCIGYESLLLGAVVPPLTPRQRDVALRAAAGEPARAIAGALGVTPKTVDNHLQGAYVALGLQSRGELSSLLGRIGPTRPDQRSDT